MDRKECVLYDRLCTNCGECDMCDLNPKKTCDNCGKCISDDTAFRSITFGMGVDNDEN